MQYRFDKFQLDIDGGTLLGPRGHITLPEKPFRLLCALVTEEGKVVSKEAAMQAVWPSQIISDASLATALKAVRRAIGDTGEAQRLIETVKGRGFRMAVPVFPACVVTSESRLDAQPTVESTSAPTLAILRFAASSETLGRAIPADLISTLSVSRDLRLIARGSSFQFFSGEARPRDLQIHCGADYTLSGYVEGDVNNRSVSIELADTRTEVVVSTMKLDLSGIRDDELSIELQRNLISVLSLKILGHESTKASGKPTEQLNAWEAYHLGVTESHRHTAEGNLRAIKLLQQAILLDPGFSSAYAALSGAAFGMAFSYFSKDRDTYLNRAIEWADKAEQIDPDNPLACTAKGRSFWLLKVPGEGIHWLDRALEIDPNSALATYSRGVLHNLTGETEAANQDLATAMQISPIDPVIYSMRGHLGVASMQQGDFKKALEWAEQSVRSPRMEHMVIFVAAVAASLADEQARTRHWKSKLVDVAPHITSARFFESMPLSQPVQVLFTKAFEQIR